MSEFARLTDLRAHVAADLTEGILPFWMTRTLDDRHGGFVGRMTHGGDVVPGAPKGAVLNARILWTFSAAGRVLGDDRYRPLARRAYRYLADYFRDAEQGGIYWMLDHAGRPLETKKQVYAQAFALYGLAEYYRLTGEEACLAWAVDLFQRVERHSFDPEYGGYLEAFSRDWKLLDDVRLSEKDANAKKTMNTHLHLLEAYTTLYQVWPDPALRGQLRHLLEVFLATILDARTGHLRLFFDEQWRSKSSLVSFGHDIEASWLLCEAAEALGEADLHETVAAAALLIARTTLDEACGPDGAIDNETLPDGRRDDDRHWWPQAEALVGFLNAYQLSGSPAFLDAALASWAYIDAHLIDRQHGEWFSRVASGGTRYCADDKVDPWKGPYHNSRMGFEVITRVDRLEEKGPFRRAAG